MVMLFINKVSPGKINHQNCKINLVKSSYLPQKRPSSWPLSTANWAKVVASKSKSKQNQLALRAVKCHLRNMWHANYGIRGSSKYLTWLETSLQNIAKYHKFRVVNIKDQN